MQLVAPDGRPLRDRARRSTITSGLDAARMLEQIELSRRFPGRRPRSQGKANGGGSVAPINPAALFPQLWLRADLGLVTGATMSWTDQGSSGAVFSQSSAPLQPAVNPTGIGGKQTLTFSSVAGTELDTATLLASVIGASSSLWTLMVVAKYTGSRTTQPNSWQNAMVIGDTAANWSSMASTTVILAYNFSGADKSVRPPFTAGTPYYALSSLSGGTLSCSVNGSVPTTLPGVGAVPTGSAMKVGGGAAGGAWWDGEIGEIIGWNRALSGAEQAGLVAYKAAQWGF